MLCPEYSRGWGDKNQVYKKRPTSFHIQLKAGPGIQAGGKFKFINASGASIQSFMVISFNPYKTNHGLNWHLSSSKNNTHAKNAL